MVAEAMTETTLGEDTRSGILVSQVGKECVQVRKAHSLIGRVYDPRNLAWAWARVKENRGAGGVDRISIDRFECERLFAVLSGLLGVRSCMRVLGRWGWAAGVWLR
jgi:RNA-directed DNA polymerase